MTVLSKQYSLLDTINFRNRDSLEQNPGNSAAAIHCSNSVHRVLIQLAKDKEHMTYNEFSKWFGAKNLQLSSVV